MGRLRRGISFLQSVFDWILSNLFFFNTKQLKGNKQTKHQTLVDTVARKLEESARVPWSKSSEMDLEKVLHWALASSRLKNSGSLSPSRSWVNTLELIIAHYSVHFLSCGSGQWCRFYFLAVWLLPFSTNALCGIFNKIFHVCGKTSKLQPPWQIRYGPQLCNSCLQTLRINWQHPQPLVLQCTTYLSHPIAG